MTKRSLSLIVWLALLVAIAAVMPTAALAQDATVTAALLESDPQTLDPQAVQQTDEFQVLYNVCEGLISYDPETLAPAPRLAESWEISDDGTVYTFHLRDGVLFHNGREMTADDVVYSLNRLANPDTGTSYTSLLLNNVVGMSDVRAEENPADSLSGVVAVDDSTVQITLSAPTASFLNQLALPGAFVVAQEAAEAEGFNENPVCTGPYTISEWVRQDHVTLSAFADYWGGAPAVQTGILRVIPQQSQQVIEFEAGNLDVAWVPEPDLQRLRDDATLSAELHSVPLLSLFHLRVNLNDEAMSNPDVRKAFAMAIDRQTLVDTVLQGQGEPADGLYPSGLTAFDDSFDPFPYDPEAARALLAEAGYPDGITLEVRTGQVETENRIMTAIAQQVAAAGITLNVNSTEGSVYDEDRGACMMQMGTIAWGMDYPDPDNLAFLIGPVAAGSRFNCGYNDSGVVDQINDLLTQGSQMPVGPERDEIYRELERIGIGENILIIPIYHGGRSALISSRLGGTPVDANSIVRFDLMTVSE